MYIAFGFSTPVARPLSSDSTFSHYRAIGDRIRQQQKSDVGFPSVRMPKLQLISWSPMVQYVFVLI